MASKFQFTMRSGPTTGAIYPLEKESLSIGRDSANGIQINDPEMSRRHARMQLQGGKYVIEDLGSTNGTLVNGQKLAAPYVLKNGDVVRGAVDKLTGDDSGVIRFKPVGEKSPASYPRSAVSAIAFDPSLARVKKAKGAFARVTTADGSRVSVSAVSADGKTLEATTLVGGKLTVPLADVIAVDVLGGKATYLSDLKPKAVKEEAFGAVAWPWAADKSVKGNPLRLKTDRGEEVFAKGLGLHSKTTLTYDLGGKYKRFEAAVGLDAATGRRGAVDVTILVDGKPHKLDGLTFAAGVKAVSIDVTKAKELTLLVDFGPGGDVQDDVNFADARLVE